MIPLFVLLYRLHCWWCWQALPAVICNRYAVQMNTPIRIGDERERLVAALTVMTKSLGPSWGKQFLGERLRETARRDTRALSSAGMFEGKAPLRFEAQKCRPHAPLAPMRSTPA
jgi:hypothetical protein